MGSFFFSIKEIKQEMTVEGEKEKNKENQKYMKRRKGEQLMCKFLSFS